MEDLTKDLKIAQIREARNECMEAIRDALLKFSKTTGLLVNDVSIIEERTYSLYMEIETAY